MILLTVTEDAKQQKELTNNDLIKGSAKRLKLSPL